ncbi:hypothetical protein BRADI_2g28421v3 [Brachypodium distachyon]|uniref:Uncharacterized protein n=1 Tax=Brachypodium distachyon TaxID=15368 RepID=A0A2K2DB30_BRADI|nr:hypothetical protein BRADI_2g28421v3 [Brachypodium distachyon]
MIQKNLFELASMHCIAYRQTKRLQLADVADVRLSHHHVLSPNFSLSFLSPLPFSLASRSPRFSISVPRPSPPSLLRSRVDPDSREAMDEACGLKVYVNGHQPTTCFLSTDAVLPYTSTVVVLRRCVPGDDRGGLPRQPTRRRAMGPQRSGLAGNLLSYHHTSAGEEEAAIREANALGQGCGRSVPRRPTGGGPYTISSSGRGLVCREGWPRL